MRRTFFALALSAGAAMAQGWSPEGPVKLIIAFAAGGGADTQARLIAEAIEEAHGWDIVPEQVTGAGGAVAAKALMAEPADGTVIAMLVTETLGYNMVAGNPGYGLGDFTLLTTTAAFQMGVVATTERGIGTMEEALAAAAEGPIRFGAMSPKLADLAYLLGRENGVDFNIVELRGGRAVVDGLNAGDLDIGFAAGIQARAVAAGEMVNLVSALSTPLAMSPRCRRSRSMASISTRMATSSLPRRPAFPRTPARR